MIIFFICASLLSVFALDGVQGRCVNETMCASPVIPKGITIHKVIATWEEANLQCQREGAVLASPINAVLLAIMKSLIEVNNAAYFIGTRASKYMQPFVSLEGVPLDRMTDAVMEMIDTLDPREGDCLRMDKNSINVTSCCERLPYICYKARTVISTESPSRIEANTEENTAPLDCGPDSEGYELNIQTGSCYKRHLTRKLWDEARMMCEQEGAYLAIVNNAIEAQAIKNMTFPPDTNWYVYIGLRNFGKTSGWKTVNGGSISDLYNVWIDGTGLKSENWCCGLFKFTGELD